jgi:hypothetical protein
MNLEGIVGESPELGPEEQAQLKEAIQRKLMCCSEKRKAQNDVCNAH